MYNANNKNNRGELGFCRAFKYKFIEKKYEKGK